MFSSTGVDGAEFRATDRVNFFSSFGGEDGRWWSLGAFEGEDSEVVWRHKKLIYFSQTYCAFYMSDLFSFFTFNRLAVLWRRKKRKGWIEEGGLGGGAIILPFGAFAIHQRGICVDLIHYDVGRAANIDVFCPAGSKAPPTLGLIVQKLKDPTSIFYFLVQCATSNLILDITSSFERFCKFWKGVGTVAHSKK